MINIAMITIHCQTNFGSALQAFALNRYLDYQGYNCRIIDYRPDYIISPHDNSIKSKIKRILKFLERDTARHLYDQFMEEYMELSSNTYYTYEDLLHYAHEEELYIVGGDQLWNVGYPCGNDDSYKLTFITDKPKISYATSLNSSKMTEEQGKYLHDRIKDFSALSLREQSSVEYVHNVLGLDAKWVCDSVFLLTANEYDSMTYENRYGEYILIYLVDNYKLLRKVTRQIVERTGYRVIYACGLYPRCSCDIHIKSTGPIDMLTLIRHAKFIITGSFHATAFSHIFRKDFIVIESNNPDRIFSLLTLSNNRDRIIRTAEQCKLLDLHVDYQNIELEDFIENSKEWLMNCVNRYESR